MSEPSGKSYKDTIILPKTEFAMKADLARREPEQLARWEAAGIYGKIRAARAGAPKFTLHDGPPYATGDLHVGTGLNKALKDFVVRYKTMCGFDTPYRPGWDCHGLPIEHKVAKELGPKVRQMTTADVRKRCLDYAMKFFARNREDFKRLLIFGEWDTPYLTVDHAYEVGVLDLFAEMVEKGYIYRSLRPIHWCMTDRTALAEAELEYEEISSPSVYVGFPIVDPGAELVKRFGRAVGADTELLIWTTTPWTLPANLAIAVHRDFDYVLVQGEDSNWRTRTLILAEELLETVAKTIKLVNYTVLARCKGRALEGLTYRHAFLDRTSPVVLADYVTLDDGTGCVHTAPGHGREDFETGRRYGLEPLSPVDTAGRLTEAAGVCAGQHVFDADPNIVKLLEDKGVLLFAAPVKHSYPHCWRCHEPVIFRSTEQWFVNVEHADLRNRLIAEVDRVKWIPDWGRSRILGMLTTRPDWCISRQRSWGVPIPAFYCVGCGQTVLTAASVRHVRDLFARFGSDHWFTHEAGELAPPDLKCPKCGGAKFEKENDIFDVWFESGSSHWSVVKPDARLNWPIDLYLEGSDQHRGWFQVSMITAMCARDDAPYEAVLTHGFVVDEKGEKMSKSKGNYISVEDATKAVGADIFRLWVASANFRDDINTSLKLMQLVGESYRKIRNTIRFILGNLFDFDPAKHAVAAADMLPVDRWAVCQANKLHRDCRGFYDEYVFHRVYGELFTFCDTTLSAFYLDALKDRLYCDAADSRSRRSAQTAIYHCVSQIIQLLAPICPFTAEEAFAAMPHRFDPAESIHLVKLAPVPGEWDDADSAEFELILGLRAEAYRAIENLRKRGLVGSSLDADVYFRLPADLGLRQLIEAFLKKHWAAMPSMLNVSGVRWKTEPLQLGQAGGEGPFYVASLPGVGSKLGFPGGEFVGVDALPSSSPKCDRCWKHLPTVGMDPANPTLCARCAAVVRQR